MPDSEPTHDNPRNVSNLPAVVHDGEVQRPAAEGWLVRAANTGVSAVIDPLGRIVARLGLGIEGVLDAGLPAALPPTIYARVGNIPAAVIVLVALAIVLRRRFVRRKA